MTQKAERSRGSRGFKPRDYQLEAARWALSVGQGIVCMPTGTGKTIIAALWIRELFRRGLARRVLVLEPTRFMVEQTARVLRELGLDARPVHGSLGKGQREAGWKSPIVVATPEIVVSEGMARLGEPDALVVDECHHTTGQDPYVKVAEAFRPRWRLGLTAYVPPSRRGMLESHIGVIRCWSWDDPRIRKYIPLWAGEVYEAPFNPVESQLYDSIERLWDQSHGVDRTILGNALRWYSRDGAEALRETYRKRGLLYRLLKGLESLIEDERVRPAHKLDALKRVLADHEGFTKAIVFVDRVVIARIIAGSLSEYNPVLLLGRRHIDPREALAQARKEDTRLIVASSAGEEGIDLPEVDLLVIWSSTASPLRFIQRLGRLLRPGSLGQKTAVFIATPDTVDMDSLIDGIIQAERAGVKVNISADVIEYLWQLSRKKLILDVIDNRPMTADMISQATGIPVTRVQSSLSWLVEHGHVIYVYTAYGRVYGLREGIDSFYEYYDDYLKPDTQTRATASVRAAGRNYTIRGKYHKILASMTRLLEKHGSIDNARFSVFISDGGVERMINAYYGYQLLLRREVKLVLDNAFSARRWSPKLAAGPI